MAPSLADLPPEILHLIFTHLDPASVVSVSLTCRKAKECGVDSQIVWRRLCRISFRFWAAHHDITNKLVAPISSVDWRALFIYRANVERSTRRLLNCVLESQQRRIQHINDVADFGYDAKETLLDEYACPDDAEDVLARRYYANVMLERIQIGRAHV